MIHSFRWVSTYLQPESYHPPDYNVPVYCGGDSVIEVVGEPFVILYTFGTWAHTLAYLLKGGRTAKEVADRWILSDATHYARWPRELWEAFLAWYDETQTKWPLTLPRPIRPDDECGLIVQDMLTEGD